MNGNTACTGWIEIEDGVWKRMVNGVTYLIEWEEGMYYLYRSTCWECVDCAAHFGVVAQSALDMEGL